MGACNDQVTKEGEGWEGWEGWKDGRMEGWKDGRMEGWKGVGS